MYCKMRYQVILNRLLQKSGFITSRYDETFEEGASSISRQQSQ